MAEEKEKLQQLLRELFQFNSADLDFGIYRIMNFKRDAIEKFIEKDLIKAVEKGIGTGVLASQSEAVAKLKEVESKIDETLGDKALTGDGVLVDAYRDTPLGKQYLELQAQISGAQSKTSLEVAVFNHLYTFFNRYYDNGDFLSKRRYSRKEKYAVPYNGEEVYLYWANSDQYYVKTGEYFNNYSFKSPFGVTIHFVVLAADVEKDNVKGDKRFFVPVLEKVEYKASSKEIMIPFHYRPLTEQEDIRYHQRNQQEEIIKKAVEEIPAKLKVKTDAVAALLGTHHADASGETVSLLEFHLYQYTRRNSFDYFVHKDLKGFLTRELDFYLKNEILNLDEIENAKENRIEGWFQILKIIKDIGGRIIEFLAQIEDYQKLLFEKKKFILETQYCLTIANIKEEFWGEIAGCEAQWLEWKDLLHLDEEKKDIFNSNAKNNRELRLTLLKAHPTLVVDTKHFSLDYKERLLASFDDLDKMTDGVLIHADNSQALSLMLERYNKEVNCIYIDPPFNTAASEILYKNDYKHSSWLSMMASRIQQAQTFMNSGAIFCIAIDDFELPFLIGYLRQIFGEDKQLSTVVVRSNPHGRAMASGFSPNHEYALFFSRTDLAEVGRLPRNESRQARYPESDEYGSFAWINFRKTGAGSNKSDRPKLYYPIFISKDAEIHIPSMNWSKENRCWEPIDQPETNESTVYPIDADGTERVWNMGWTRAQDEAHLNLVAKQVNGQWQIYRKYRPNQEGALPGTWWEDAKYSATESGTKIIKDLFGERESFSYPKSIFLVEDSLRAANCSPTSIVLDFFAGSGTTAHAVVNLNRVDGGKRKCILVEIGDHFDTVLLPRIKKVTFTPDWKDGKPTRQATPEEATRSPRIIKYLRLESYEDSLNNIKFTGAQQGLYDFNDYLLKYMLSWETKDSETLLNVENLNQPFDYKLNIVNGQESRQEEVDIPETFAYLLGLRTKTRRVYSDDGRRYLVYHGNVDHREITVIWRNNAGWEKKDYVRDRKFVAEQKLTESTDEIFVNGDSLIPGAQTLDGVFKSRMFGGL
ncbi:Type III restriction-modification system methylation subunit [Dehalococcoides mccartyi]|uniref:site-specific DNA-methyltransferase n=1 Tax=Dehalococcoides mccartyi TaxID=61435 RepID=UPI0015E64E4B|nr:DNA methyltransferase [Dehalococcoides mccartyi]MBA2084701.1 Type III restriction-modification system methylation subunit [Dehalococcoides mccartyi]